MDTYTINLEKEHKHTMKCLLYIRKNKKISQTTLAKKIGVDQPTISRWERGDHPIPLGYIGAYADAVGYKASLSLSPV